MQHENQRIESVSRFFCESAKLLGLLVDLSGIEPMTSSMPWKRAPKLRHRPTYFRDATCLLSPLGRDSSNPAASGPDPTPNLNPTQPKAGKLGQSGTWRETEWPSEPVGTGPDTGCKRS